MSLVPKGVYIQVNDRVSYCIIPGTSSICDMIYSMEAKVGISKVEIQVKIGGGGEFWQK